MRRIKFPLAIGALVWSAALSACGDDETVTPATDVGADAAASLDAGDVSGADVAVSDVPSSDVEADHIGDDESAMDVAPNDSSDTAGEVGPTFDELHAGLFAVSCAELGCHYGVGLDFGVADGLEARLLGDSSESDLPLLAPGDLDGSYMWHKLHGTHESVGGSGSQMPLSGSVTEAQLDLLRRYIEVTLAAN
ncbi:MAG: hypothetical protein H6698_06925 [Myxococcales bacterium]|nr:hypothetical protein [Myxococcales bacterium]MCB9531448.1 hypothetical protein [Myxococcales bacterium]MCB9534041.1 hypothetical protein [Myxococcales bacterium]